MRKKKKRGHDDIILREFIRIKLPKLAICKSFTLVYIKLDIFLNLSTFYFFLSLVFIIRKLFSIQNRYVCTFWTFLRCHRPIYSKKKELTFFFVFCVIDIIHILAFWVIVFSGNLTYRVVILPLYSILAWA